VVLKRPKKVPLQIVAPGNSENITNDDAVSMGMVKIDCVDVKRLRELGIEVQGAGTMLVDKGGGYIHKRVLTNCALKLESMVEGAGEEEIHNIAASLSKLAKAMADIISKAGSASEEKAAGDKPRRTFSPNSTAIFANSVHINDDGQPKHGGIGKRVDKAVMP